MKDSTKAMVKQVKELLKKLDPDERLEVWDECMMGYCTDCGADQLPCNCYLGE